MNLSLSVSLSKTPEITVWVVHKIFRHGDAVKGI